MAKVAEDPRQGPTGLFAAEAPEPVPLFNSSSSVSSGLLHHLTVEVEWLL